MIRYPLALGLMAATACAHGGHPLPKALAVEDTAELLRRMESANSTVQSYVGEARLTYFGAEGRRKGTATLAVQRPDRFRYQLLAPTGTVLEAFATNGKGLQLLTEGGKRFLVGDATPANLDLLMTIAPLGFAPAEWVALLFGELDIPPSATVDYNATTGVFELTYDEGGRRLVADVDPATSQVVGLHLLGGEAGDAHVRIEERDAKGLPATIHIEVPARPLQVNIVLRDTTYDPGHLVPATFQLRPPRGVEPEMF